MTNPQIKLTLEQAIEIRRRYENPGRGGAGQSSLAAEYGVGKSMINMILAGRHPLVRGVPDIRALRGRGPADGGHPPSVRGMTDTARRTVGDGRAKRGKSQREYRQRPCPVCYARKGEYCQNLQGGGYTRDRAQVHDERRH